MHSLDDLPRWDRRYLTNSGMLIEQVEHIPGDIHCWLEVERQLLELLSYRSWHLYFNDVKRYLVEAKVVPTKSGSVFGTGCKEF